MNTHIQCKKSRLTATVCHLPVIKYSLFFLLTACVIENSYSASEPNRQSISHQCPGVAVVAIKTEHMAGVNDGFNLQANEPEINTRSPEVQALIDAYANVGGQSNLSRANRPFDVMSNDQYFGHTFSGLPKNIIHADLEIRLKGGGSNDQIGVLDSTGSIAWLREIKSLPETGGTWSLNPVQDVVFNFNLEQLTNADNSNTNLLSEINVDQSLDVLVQDDTAVDYIKLTTYNCLQPKVDIAIDKQLLRTSTPPEPGSQVHYQVTVTNLGPDNATNIIVNDVLPAGLGNVTASVTGVASGSSANYDSEGELTITSLAAAEGMTLNVTATVDALACGDIINTASLASVDQVDLDASNNQATVGFALAPCVSCTDPVNGSSGSIRVVLMNNYFKNNALLLFLDRKEK